MAKIAFSPLVNEVRGKMGTVVFTNAKNGPTARAHGSVRNPKSLAQRAVRSYLSKAAKTFKTMTTTQAAAWNAYGSTIVRHNPVTGETFTLSGISAFVELTAKLLQLNPTASIPLAPPTSEFPGDTITLTATAGTGQVTFTASAPNAIGVTTEVLLQKLPSLNRKPNPDGYTHAGWKAFFGGSLDLVVSMPAGYYAAGYRFVKTATGQASPIVTLPVQTVAFSLAADGAPKKKAA